MFFNPAALRMGLRNAMQLEALLQRLMSSNQPVAPRRHAQHGPGVKTIHTIHRNLHRSKYSPHQGAQERARRIRQGLCG